MGEMRQREEESETWQEEDETSSSALDSCMSA